MVSSRRTFRDMRRSNNFCLSPHQSNSPVPSLSPSTRRVFAFLGKAVAIYALWYVAYDLWLLPDGRLDRWVSVSVVEISRSFLDLLGFAARAEGRGLSIPGTPGVRIVDGCNGLSTIGLFVGFVLAFPGTPLRRTLFLPTGILVVYLSNVTRIVLLLLLQLYYPPGFDFVHSLGAPTFFYLVVFGLWMLWANYGGRPKRESPTPKYDQAQATGA